MNPETQQRATSADGTEIVGRVCGHGPPLVLVHGAMADGELEWGELLPLLTDRFTCYLPSLRGRGSSGSHPDVSRSTRVGDVVAFVDSIGEPVDVVGVSGGAMLALGAASRSTAITGVVTYEPVVIEAIEPELLARVRAVVERVSAAAERGSAAEAAGEFFELICNDEELAAFSGDTDGLAAVAQYLQVDIAEFREGFALQGRSPTAPDVLSSIPVPVLVLHGSRSALGWFADGARFAAEHIPGAVIREVNGTGHLGHLTAPGVVASELISFLERTAEHVK